MRRRRSLAFALALAASLPAAARALIEVGSLEPDEVTGVAIAGSIAWVADFEVGLRAIDVSDPAAPVEVGVVAAPGSANHIAIDGSLACVVGGNSSPGSFLLVDVSNPAAPALLHAGGLTGEPKDVDLVGNRAYVVSGSTLHVIDVSNPASPATLGSIGTSGSALGVEVVGSLAYVVAGNAGTSPTSPLTRTWW